VWEIFSSVLNGGSVQAFAAGDVAAGGMAAWLRRQHITIFSAVPTVFRQLVSTLTGAETFPSLRLVILGGDAVSRRDVDLLRAHFPADCILASTLAATEAGTFLRYFVDRATRIADNVVPAGHPPDGKEVSLLDDQGREVGVGEIREIVVRSLYRATGYWRRPELTRAKFLPDPRRWGCRALSHG
jgi:non-ribosomal peptide synthetase component F